MRARGDARPPDEEYVVMWRGFGVEFTSRCGFWAQRIFCLVAPEKATRFGSLEEAFETARDFKLGHFATFRKVASERGRVGAGRGL